jgi:hypothetical protein
MPEDGTTNILLANGHIKSPPDDSRVGDRLAEDD